LRRIITTIAISVFLASCTPDISYDLPEKEIANSFIVQEIINNISSNDNIDAQWWKSFKDPLLNKIIEDSLTHNLDILEALETVKEAKIKLKLVGIDNDFLAKISGSSTAIEEHNLNSLTDNKTTRDTLAGLSISFTPDFFGKEKPEQDLALAELRYNQEELKATTIKATSDIVSEYISLRASQEQLNLLKQSVILQEKTLIAVKERFNAGLSPELDYQRAINAVEILKADLPTIEQNIQKSKLNLCKMVGIYSEGYSFLLSQAKKMPEYNGTIPSILPMNIINSHPDVRKSEEDLKQALANIGIANAAKYPDFTISGQINFGTQHISSANVTNILIGSITALIEQTLFDSGKTSLNVELAKKQTDIYMIRYQKSINDTLENIENSYVDIKTFSDKTEALKKALNASQKSVEQAEVLYKNGIIDLLDLIDTQRNLSSNKIKLSQAMADNNISIANLFLAIGFGN